MGVRALNGSQALVRIFVAESDKYEHRHAAEILLERAREGGIAGCTVLRFPYGYGTHHLFHSELAFDGAGDWCDVIELVDGRPRLQAFMEKVRPILSGIGAFATEEKVKVHRYAPISGTQPQGKAPASAEFPGILPPEGDSHLLLRVFIGESDKIGHHPLYLVLLETAREMQMAGCTVLRGIAGFGASSIVHTPHLFRVSSDPPILLEIIDRGEKIRGFLDRIQPMLKGVLVTEEEIRVHRYSASEGEAAAS